MKLSLAEGLMLIALDDEEGRLLSAAEHSIDHGLLATLILELSLIHRVSFEDSKVVVKDPSGTGNKVLDSVLEALGSGGDSLVDTIQKIAPRFHDIQDAVVELLVQRGIIRVESTKLFWIPVSERMDNANYAFEQEIRDTLKGVVYKKRKPTMAIIILLSMLFNCKVLGEVFQTEDELIDAEKITKDIVNSPAMDKHMQAVLTELKHHFATIH